MTDAVTPDPATFLQRQHDEVKQLFAQVEGAVGDDRADLFDSLVRLLAVHETAEEVVVYPAIRTAPGGDAIVEARLHEEDEAKEALAELEGLGTDDPSFGPKIAALRAAVLAHATSEEQTVFPLLREAIPAGHPSKMTAALELAEDMAPSHPHPDRTESGDTASLVSGRFVAIADKVRDALN
jgi:hemerythrin superfamily protein